MRRSCRYTLAIARPITGRRHQIRVHAAWIGHPIVGDKLYGPDEMLMPKFIAHGFTDELAAQLKMERQALHAYEISFPAALPREVFRARMPTEFREFWMGRAGNELTDIPLEIPFHGNGFKEYTATSSTPSQ